MRRWGAEITDTRRPGARDSAGGTAASSTGSAARLSEMDKKGVFIKSKRIGPRLVSQSPTLVHHLHSSFDCRLCCGYGLISIINNVMTSSMTDKDDL